MKYLPFRFSYFFLFIFLFFLYFYLFPINIFAKEGTNLYDYSLEKANTERREAAKAAENGQTLMTGGSVSAYTLLMNVVNFDNMLGCTDPTNCKPEKTALGTVSKAIAMIYQNQPASLAYYAHDTLADLGFAKKAYAQGIGIVGLYPLLGVWKAARNIAYAVLVLVMVAIGFMIVFRMKIDPKTVISVQAAIPKVILTMILITFSYPIVGFLVDIMYLVMAILIDVMAKGMGGPFLDKSSELQTQYMTGGLPTLMGAVFSGGFRSLDDFFGGFKLQLGIGSGAITAIIAVLTNVVAWSSLGLIAAAPSALILGIIFLGLLFSFIRIFLMLINSYIQLLINLTLAPILLLVEAIPGRSAFSEWILTVIANLSVFPTTVALLMFGMFLTSSNSNDILWQPPLVGTPGPNIFTAFLGMSVIFTTPTMVASIKKIFNPKLSMPITAGTAIMPLTTTAQTGLGMASQFYYMKSMPFIGGLLGGDKQHRPHS